MLVVLTLLVYRIPGFLQFLLERPKVHIDKHFVLALEGFWHSPRVPAGASSAILKLAGGQHVSGFIDNLQFWRAEVAAVPGYAWAVLFARLAND